VLPYRFGPAVQRLAIMSLWLVGKKRSITLMAAQSANGTAMNMTTRIAISRLVILFVFPPASNRYLRSTLIRNISLPRDPARPAPINEQQAEEINKRSV